MIPIYGEVRIVGVVLGDDVGVLGWQYLCDVEEYLAEEGDETPYSRVARKLEERAAREQADRDAHTPPVRGRDITVRSNGHG